jgi:hypothetical protein
VTGQAISTSNEDLWRTGLGLRLLLLCRALFITLLVGLGLAATPAFGAAAGFVMATGGFALVFVGVLQAVVVGYTARSGDWPPQSGLTGLAVAGVFIACQGVGVLCAVMLPYGFDRPGPMSIAVIAFLLSVGIGETGLIRLLRRLRDILRTLRPAGPPARSGTLPVHWFTAMIIIALIGALLSVWAAMLVEAHGAWPWGLSAAVVVFVFILAFLVYNTWRLRKTLRAMTRAVAEDVLGNRPPRSEQDEGGASIL